MDAGGCCRAVRAAVFAAVCVLLAAAGHVLMSGLPLPWWALAAGAAAAGGTAWCLAGRERGLPLVVSVAVAAQGVLHTAFSLAQTADGPPAPTHAMHHDMSHSMRHGMPHGMAHDMAGMSSTGMFAAHLLAAVLCGLWLAYGERAAFRILRTLAGWFAAPLRLLLVLPVPPRRPRIRARRARTVRAPRRLLLVHVLTTRGPPAGTAVV
ncbi:hypothetical protein C3486_24985 [Streptomyces sp. Ru73]|uniref:hypothetical protein n=1 Tax=Streptomyces sp. Ru73 TaxID=2080748 RepID=UPI000CDD8D7D|nr:hypothetical protein [Streptomyces sp. Ru73]POX38045.1 hypothetical protein C3486_24985 [Streptomyces sp. Ru73]